MNLGYRITPAHEYRVTWDQRFARFDIYRDAEPTGAFASDKATAVALAIGKARREADQTGLAIIVASMQDGKRVVEWDEGHRHRQAGS
jgi:hypothetical protein